MSLALSGFLMEQGFFIERFFNKITEFRRIASSYEKLDRKFLKFLHLVCAFIWILSCAN